jgi:hypothetical protein
MENNFSAIIGSAAILQTVSSKTLGVKYALQ